MFNRYDTSADGIITFEEFKAALSEANFSETTLKDMFESVVSCCVDASCLRGSYIARGQLN